MWKSVLFWGCFSRNAKKNQRKEEKRYFGSNFGPTLTILGKSWVTVIVKMLKLNVTLFDQVIHWNNVFYFIQECYDIQKLYIADFVKSIFSLVQEGGHFLADTGVLAHFKHYCTYKYKISSNFTKFPLMHRYSSGQRILAGVNLN